MEQDTGKFRTNTRDQYYTSPTVAKHCVDVLLSRLLAPERYQWVEPSAGNGVFLKALPADLERLGMDIDPKGGGIVRGDFLAWTPTTQRPRIFFGNPPFGRQSSAAKAFIRHAAVAGAAEIIAFILPRSFVKPSMSRAFPPHFHCLHSEELARNSFVVNDTPYDVPCVFQIWKKKAEPRPAVEAIKEVGFAYVKPGETFHLALKRVGGLAGQAARPGGGAVFNPQYHYFLRMEERYVARLDEILAAVNAHVFPTNTVGPRSLSKSEVNEVLNAILTSYS